MSARLDGAPVDVVAAASREGRQHAARWVASSGAGQRCYLAVQGGFDLPDYLGSRSTFTLGQFGGHGGRALRTGDVLRLARPAPDLSTALADAIRRWRCRTGALA